jgi:hypothetical protein
LFHQRWWKTQRCILVINSLILFQSEEQQPRARRRELHSHYQTTICSVSLSRSDNNEFQGRSLIEASELWTLGLMKEKERCNRCRRRIREQDQSTYKGKRMRTKMGLELRQLVQIEELRSHLRKVKVKKTDMNHIIDIRDQTSPQ